jgi:hypothetical protein
VETFRQPAVPTGRRVLSAAPVEPDDLRTVLIDALRERSVVIASGVPVVPTDKKAVQFPMLTGDVTAAFFDELEEITPSDPDFDEFVVPVKALKALCGQRRRSARTTDAAARGSVSCRLATGPQVRRGTHAERD